VILLPLIGWYRLNGDALDSSGNGNHGVVSGSGSWSTAGKTGQARDFTADDSEVAIPHNALLSSRIFGTATRFSMSVWFYPVSFENYGVLVAKGSSTSYSNTTAGIWAEAGGVAVIMGTNEGGNPSGSYITVTYEPTLNEWHHVVAVADGTHLHLYVDRVLRGSALISGLTRTRSENAAQITIGPRFAGANTSKVRGSVCDLRLYDHDLSLKEVIELGRAKVLHMQFDQETVYPGTVRDISGYGNDSVLTTDAPTWSTDSAIGLGAYEFDGVSQRIPVESTLMDLLKRSSFSISFRLKSEDVTGLVRDVFGGGNYGNTYGGVAFSHHSSNQWYYDLYLEPSGRRALTISDASGVIPFNEWNHIILTRDRAASTMSIRVNGVLISTLAGVTGTEDLRWNEGTFPLLIGKGYYASTLGLIDDFRIYLTALSESDAVEIYQNRASLDSKGNLWTSSTSEYHTWNEDIQAYNLVINGDQEMQDNYNFTSMTYDSEGDHLYCTSGSVTLFSGGFIPIDPNDIYAGEGEFKNGNPGNPGRFYYGFDCYDKNKLRIDNDMVNHYTNTKTTLAQDLNNGDTQVHLTSAANWSTVSTNLYDHRKTIAFWGSQSEYPEYTYTRVRAHYLTIAGNALNLRYTWAGGFVPAGTPVVNALSGGTFIYRYAGNLFAPEEWTKYGGSTATSTGWFVNNTSQFRYGTAYVKMLFLLNRNASPATTTTLLRNLRFWNMTSNQLIYSDLDTFKIDKHGITRARKFSEVGPVNGLKAWYPFKYDANDLTENALDGTITGATAYLDTERQAYNFSGGNHYIDLPFGNGEDPTSTPRTYTMWVRVPSASGDVMCFSAPVGSNQRLYIGKNSSKWDIGIQASPWATGTPSAAVAANQWTFVVLTMDGSTANLYADNVLSISKAYTSYTLSGDFKLGYLSGSIYWWEGQIGETRIYDRVLSLAELGILRDTTGPSAERMKRADDGTVYTKGSLREV